MNDMPQLNKPTSIAVTIICRAIMAVIATGLWAISVSGPGMVLMKKEPLARLKRTIIQNNTNLPPYTRQQKIPYIVSNTNATTGLFS